MRVPILLLALPALLLAGCGEADPGAGTPKTEAAPTSPAPEPVAPATGEPPAARPTVPPPPPKRTGSLKPRAGDVPLEAGATAPAFGGRPEGRSVVLFYRGHW